MEGGEPVGFATPSRKIELQPEILAGLDVYALTGNPQSASQDFPLQLIVGSRKQPYYASSYRQIAELRAAHPLPWAEMSPATAAQLGVADGSPMRIETGRGEASFVAKLAEMVEGGGQRRIRLVVPPSYPPASRTWAAPGSPTPTC